MVCPTCSKRAVDSSGRPLVIAEQFSKNEEVIYLGGPAAYFKDPDPEAGELCEEATDSLMCWVDGVEVKILEGFAGWIGLVLP